MSILSNAVILSSGGNLSVVLSVGGKSFTGFTSGSWSISAESTEQQADLTFFTNSIPQGMAYPELVPGEAGTLSVGQLLYITGEISGRTGKIGKDGYSLNITFSSNGKRLQKSTAKVGSGQALNTTPRKLISEIASNSGVDVEFGDVEDELIKQHISIGDRNSDEEIKSIGRDRGYLIYETHEGKIRVEGNNEGIAGCDLILGLNIIEAQVSDRNDKERGKIKTVGTRNLSGETNRAATLSPPGEAQMGKAFLGEFVRWADGDQTPASLRRLALFERNRRVAAGKEAQITVFGLVAPNGEPIRVNAKHFVSIPTEGIADVLRVKSADFSFDKSGEEVRISLSPIASLSNTMPSKRGGIAKAKAAIARKSSKNSDQAGSDWTGVPVEE